MDEAQDEQHDPTLQAKEEMSVNDEQEVISDTTENDDVAKNLYDAEEFLANFSELRLENDQLKRTNDQLQIELEKAREELEQMVIDKSDLEAILRQERDHHKEELWKVRGDLQKIQEERLLWKEKYLDIYMKNGTSGSGINIDTSPSGKIRPGKRKQGTLNTENEQEFYSNLSTSFGLTNQDEQPVAVIILKKKTSYTNIGTRLDYAGVRHEAENDLSFVSRNKSTQGEKSSSSQPFSGLSSKLTLSSPLTSKPVLKIIPKTVPASKLATLAKSVQAYGSATSRYPKRLQQVAMKPLGDDANKDTTEEKNQHRNGENVSQSTSNLSNVETSTRIVIKDGVELKNIKYKQGLKENRKYFSIDDSEVEQFNKNVKEIIEAVSVGDQSKKQYKCIICQKYTVEYHNAVSHSKTHVKTKPYRCNQCTSSFNELLKLNIHVNVKHRNSRFKCQKCDAQFTSLGARYKHMKMYKHRNKDP